MSASLAIGLALTAISVVVFLAWTWHEVRRIDGVIDEVDDRLAGDEGDDA